MVFPPQTLVNLFGWRTGENQQNFVDLQTLLSLFAFLFIGTEAQCIGHFRLIFSLLRMTKATQLQKFALEVRQSLPNNV